MPLVLQVIVPYDFTPSAVNNYTIIKLIYKQGKNEIFT
jgi:hypothetical protein